MTYTLTKLCGMSGTELSHRVRERFRRTADRWRFRVGAPVLDIELEELIRLHGSSLKTYFLHGPARRFYGSTQDRESVVSFFEQRYPEWLDRAIQEARAVCEHRVNLFAQRDLSLGADIDWHRDPISDFRWPCRYWADFDLVNAPPADVKIIHELNRHAHVTRLAKAFFLTRDHSYAHEAVAQMESWIEQNPRCYGVNWQSSLEIAIRSMSWLWTIFLLLPSLEEEQLRRVCASLFAQLDHVSRYPSIYTSPNTHLIGEAAALFIAGVLFPELPRAGTWREVGALTLVQEMERQVLNDGVYGELSSYYHCYATDFYLHALVLARYNGIPFPDRMWERLSQMFEFVMHITRRDGTIPLLGDDDGGRVLPLASENYSSYRDGLCSGAVLFRRPEFKYQAAEFCEESLWLLGDEAWSVFNSLPANAPAEVSSAFEDAGYSIQRSGWRPDDTQVTFDAGGLGFSSGGHGHADALSITVFSGGYEFLIDPGTSAYNCAPEWRRFFRSTNAHNTVVVDGKGQCQPGSTFQWKSKASGILRQRIALAEVDYVDGVVEFQEIPKGMMHRRRLVHIRPNYWIVLDELHGKGVHDFDFLSHFAPHVQLTVLLDESRGEIDCRARIENAGLQLCMYGSESLHAEAICGQRAPIQGWTSRLYGERSASPVLRASMHAMAPVAMLSFLVPGSEPVRSRRFKANTNRTIAAAIRDGDYDDIAVMAIEDGDLHLMDCDMRGEFFWLRMEQGRLRRLFAVNAYSFSYGGEPVFDGNEAIPYVQVSFCENGILIERGEQGKVYVRDLRDRQFQRY